MVALLAAHHQDLLNTLVAINPAANIFGVSYISNIEVSFLIFAYYSSLLLYF